MRPTREEYKERFIEWAKREYPGEYLVGYRLAIFSISEEIYKKYLSEPNSVESPETKSE